MKKLAVILSLSGLTTGVFAQGLINFFNNPTTLISVGAPGGAANVMAANNPGAYYFGLLTAAPGSANFTFANVYGTNLSAAGRFTGGNGVAVPGWGAGVTMDYKIAGWSKDLGPTFNASWLTQPPSSPFGLSGIGTGAAGGSTSTGTLPNFNVFGGTGLTSGFIVGATVPEPSSMALAGFGAAALLIFRRLK